MRPGVIFYKFFLGSVKKFMHEHFVAVYKNTTTAACSPAFNFNGFDVFYILKLKWRCESHSSAKLFCNVASECTVFEVCKVAQLTI